MHRLKFYSRLRPGPLKEVPGPSCWFPLVIRVETGAHWTSKTALPRSGWKQSDIYTAAFFTACAVYRIPPPSLSGVSGKKGTCTSEMNPRRSMSPHHGEGCIPPRKVLPSGERTAEGQSPAGPPSLPRRRPIVEAVPGDSRGNADLGSGEGPRSTLDPSWLF